MTDAEPAGTAAKTYRTLAQHTPAFTAEAERLARTPSPDVAVTCSNVLRADHR
jgi:hypothetical protein